MLEYIALAIIIGCLIAIAVIIIRRFPTVAAIDVSQTTTTIAEKKSSLIEQRLRRKFTAWGEKISTYSGPVTSRLKKFSQQAQRRLVDLEHEYKVRSLPVLLNRRQRRKVDSQVAILLEQAKLLLTDHEERAAEDKALQAIRLEPRSVPAFEFLGQLYLQTKEYGHAKEVYLYLLKLTGESDAIYEHLAEADMAEGHLTEAKQEFQKAIDLNRSVMVYHLELAQVYRQLEDYSKAFASIQEAARLEPNNPKVLDEYLEISIVYGKKQFAQDALNKIKDSNPDNSKIPEWEERIAGL